MNQKMIVTCVIFLANFSNSFASTVGYINLPLVKEVTASELDDFNSYINGCDNILMDYDNTDTLVQLEPGRSILDKDCQSPGAKGCKAIGDYRGMQNVKEAKIIREVALIDGPANLRRQPNGILLKANLSDKSFVLITRELKDWRFVTDGENTGWTHTKNLLSKPSGIYIKKNKGVDQGGKGLDKFIGEWAKRKKDREIELALMQDKPACPKGMSHFDEDGLEITLDGDHTPAYNLLVKCGGTKNWDELPRAVSISLKKDECTCYSGDFADGFKSSKKINKKSANFKFLPNEGEERCRIGIHFIICDKPSECYDPPPGDCSMPAIYKFICPKECLNWKQKK